NFHSASLWLFARLAKMHSFGGRLEQNLVADASYPRDLIIHDATVLRAVEPSQIRFLHFLALAHEREFMAELVDGHMSLAKAARSFQDKECEARDSAVSKPAVLCQPVVHERETLECHQVLSQHVLDCGLFRYFFSFSACSLSTVNSISRRTHCVASLLERSSS
ncbi:MAG: hypothetical protein ACKPKO_35270, partial [Candidatus Fonsibacter sp.]